MCPRRRTRRTSRVAYPAKRIGTIRRIGLEPRSKLEDGTIGNARIGIADLGAALNGWKEGRSISTRKIVCTAKDLQIVALQGGIAVPSCRSRANMNQQQS